MPLQSKGRHPLDRRKFTLFAAAVGAAKLAFASSGVDCTPGLVQQELDAGKTVFIDFYTDWCTTCRAQQRVISALKSENPDYEANNSFVSVDWDKYRYSNLARGQNIPRRPTLVILRGEEELGRIVAGTHQSAIRELMDTAFSAAVA